MTDHPTEKDLAEMHLQFSQWEREEALKTLIKLSKKGMPELPRGEKRGH